MGSSPVKQLVGVQLGFGPEADANLKAKINPNKGMPKGFNTTGSSASTTPTHSTTKAATKAATTGPPYAKPVTYGGQTKAESITKQKKARAAKKVSSKMNNQSAKIVAKKGLKSTILKGVGQIAKRFAGPVGVALTAYEVGSWAYKNRKSISKNAQTTLQDRAKRSTKGFDPFTPKN